MTRRSIDLTADLKLAGRFGRWAARRLRTLALQLLDETRLRDIARSNHAPPTAERLFVSFGLSGRGRWL